MYQPSDKEINEKLQKAKSMNKKIMKDTHPDEYKKQQEKESAEKKKKIEEKKKKEQEEKDYNKVVKERMT